jgi:MoaA/NifB/PqqE/SkfB family radical SAM enzyme
MRSNYKDTDKFIDFANEYNFDIVYMMPIWGGQQIEENIYIENNFNIMSELSDKISIAEKKARDYNIRFFHSIPIINKKDNCNEITIDKKNQKGEDKTKVDNVKIDVPKEKITESLFCYLPWQQLNIDPGGIVRPGCLCSKHVGNIEESSILSIWNNQQMQEYRKKIVSNPQNWCNIDCINNIIGMDLRKV